MLEFAAICLAANIYFEARNQPLDGQIAVAQVTMNRASHDVNRVCEVTLKRKQFSWLNGKTNKNETVILAAFEQPKEKKAWAKSKEIANKVLKKRYRDRVAGATHYHTTRVNPKWNRSENMTKVTVIGDHIFYRAEQRPVVTTVASYEKPVIKRAVYQVPQKKDKKFNPVMLLMCLGGVARLPRNKSRMN